MAVIAVDFESSWVASGALFRALIDGAAAAIGAEGAEAARWRAYRELKSIYLPDEPPGIQARVVAGLRKSCEILLSDPLSDRVAYEGSRSRADLLGELVSMLRRSYGESQ